MRHLKINYLVFILFFIVVGYLFYNYISTDNSVLFKNDGKANVNLNKLSESAGYKISWQGDKNDNTGRTILADGKRSEELFEEKFGWKATYNNKLKYPDLTVGFGVFKEFKEIPNSKDLYIVLTNPNIKTEQSNIIGRIFMNENISTNTALFSPTALVVEDLNYGYKNKKIAPSKQFNTFNKMSRQNILKILKPGDIVSLYTIPLSPEEEKIQHRLILVDNQNVPYILTVAIRRFGGKTQVDAEL